MKNFKKILSLLLVLVLMVCSLASCSGDVGIGGGDVVMRYGDCVLTETDYAYLLSYVKGYYEYMFMNQYGSSFVMDDFMDMEMSTDGMTLAEMLDSAVQEAAKMMLVVEQICKDNNLKITDADSLKEIETYMSDLEHNYGGRDAFAIQLAKLGYNASAVERYEQYNLYLGLLKDFRYGENGSARLPEAEVEKIFAENYVRAEGYLYSYTDSSRNPILYDFASEYAAEDVKAFYGENNLIDYLSFKDEAKAKEAYDALSSGEGTTEDFVESCYKSATNKFVSQHSLSASLYDGMMSTEEGAWYLSGAEGGVYYVIRRNAVTDELYNETMEKNVRDAMLLEEAYAYFLENFYTVRHILYTDKAKATQVYNDILAGKTTFAEHEKDTQDGGVQYTFTDGVMLEEFEAAAKTMEIGSYQLVETDYGWHLMTRLELDTKTGFSASDAVAAMSRDLFKEDALKQLSALKSGTAFAEPAKGAMYTYSKPTLLNLSEQLAVLSDAFKKAEVGEYFMVDATGYGIFLLQKQATTAEDLKSVYEKIEETLVSDAYYEYIHTFFDSVTVNQEVLNRFNVRTAHGLDDIFYY